MPRAGWPLWMIALRSSDLRSWFGRHWIGTERRRSGSNAGGASAPTPSRCEFMECTGDVGADVSRHVKPGQLHALWTHILDGADELTLGIHCGSTDRIDFAVRALSSQTTSSLAQLAAAPRVMFADFSIGIRPKLRNLSVERGRVRGSFLVRGEQFDDWLASVFEGSPLASIPQPRH